MADLRGDLAVGSSIRSRSRPGKSAATICRRTSTPGFRPCSRAGNVLPRLHAGHPQPGRLGRLHLGLHGRFHARGRRALELGAEALRLLAHALQRPQPCLLRAERDLGRADGPAHPHLAPQRTGDLYTRYTRGLKAGHYNSLATDRLERCSPSEETTTHGRRAARALARRPLSASAAFFYYHYNDYQVFLFATFRAAAGLEIPTPTRRSSTASRSRRASRRCKVWRRACWMGSLLRQLELAHGEYIDFQNVRAVSRSAA